MSDLPKDGGPAFPVHITGNANQYAFNPYGMSLRDYFAGQALIGILAGDTMKVISTVANATNTSVGKTSVGMAYEFADAMLEARSK